jgi:uncharacterized protein YaaQ
MKLVIAIVQDEDARGLVDALKDKKIGATKLSSTGGFLRQGNRTVLIGVEEERVEEVMDIIGENCREREIVATIPPMVEEASMILQSFNVRVGGATVFVVDVDQFRKL